jgi:cell volume regulation protein A
VLAKAFPDSPMRSLLAMESAISEALAVVVVLAMMGLGENESADSAFWGNLGISFLIAGGIALVTGLVWLWLLNRLYNQRFFYLLTIGLVFLLMGVVEFLHGSGVFAVLVFGIILSNGETIFGVITPRLRERLRTLFVDGNVALHPKISESHAEISFFIRCFFFVYLGIVFQWPGADMGIWLTVLIFSVAVIVGREVAVLLAGWTTGIPGRYRAILGNSAPRGLATAVLMAILAPRIQEGSWETLAVFIVLISNIWMTIGIARLSRESSRPERRS